MLSSAESSVESSHAARESRATSLHRVVWRWHFYAGLFVAPVLFVIALTGAIYIFKDDVEPWLYPSLLVVEPRSEAVPLETLVQAAESAAGANSRATFLTVFAEPTRSAKIAVRTSEGGRKKSRSYFVDPYTGQVLGPTPWFDFFEIVRTIHRRLFLSTIGRLIVELATSWAIVLFATGVYLWRPRKLSQVAGVWRPRPNPKPYAALRDIHALAGVYLLPITLTIALTGLLYSSMVGWFFDQAAEATHAYAVFTPPQSPSPAEARSLSLDAAV
ncbi:MAG TPA: PepSY-associated TM helix domain-containing protein, partial [Pirellulales bacterium]